jgi:hypothetical protein
MPPGRKTRADSRNTDARATRSRWYEDVKRKHRCEGQGVGASEADLGRFFAREHQGARARVDPDIGEARETAGSTGEVQRRRAIRRQPVRQDPSLGGVQELAMRPAEAAAIVIRRQRVIAAPRASAARAAHMRDVKPDALLAMRWFRRPTLSRSRTHIHGLAAGRPNPAVRRWVP